MNVTVFTRQSCAPCKTVKYWLGKKGIAFTEKDVDTNMDEFTRSGGALMVPLILVGDRAIQGANLPLLSKLLVV